MLFFERLFVRLLICTIFLCLFAALGATCFDSVPTVGEFAALALGLLLGSYYPPSALPSDD